MSTVDLRRGGGPRLEGFQSRTLRYISNSRWCVRNYGIRAGLKITSLEEFVRYLALNVFTDASLSSPAMKYGRRTTTLQGSAPLALFDNPPIPTFFESGSPVSTVLSFLFATPQPTSPELHCGRFPRAIPLHPRYVGPRWIPVGRCACHRCVS